MKKSHIWIVCFQLILLISIFMRVLKLDLRPMHHDEANQAIKFGVLLQEGQYNYDPLDHHGPSLYYLSLPLIKWLRGNTFSDCTENDLRLVPALFGIGILLLLPLLKNALSEQGFLFTALFSGLSPVMVFYSRYYIQETLLIFFIVGTICAGWRYYCHPGKRWAILLGFFMGMIYATKESSLIIFITLALSVYLTYLNGRHHHDLPIKKKHFQWRHHMLTVGTALIVIILLYTSFLKNPSGLLDSITAFKHHFSRAIGSGLHDKPWFYYLRLLAFCKYPSGPVWSEALILLLAIAGGLTSFKKRNLQPQQILFGRFICFYTLISILIFSAIPYKTPWNLLPFYTEIIILAGIGGSAFIKIIRNNSLGYAAILILIAAITHLSWQSISANFKYYADTRNPYVYAHTVPDFIKLISRIKDLSAIAPDGKNILIKVVTNGTDAWPLPWYLRQFNRVGYWQNATAAEPLADAAIIVSSEEKGNKIASLVGDSFQPALYGLRPGVFLTLYVRQDLWQAFLSRRSQ